MFCRVPLAAAILNVAIAGACAGGVPQDDRYTVGLWHMDSATYNVTPDDVNSAIRPVNNMGLGAGAAGYVAVVTDGNEGMYGEAVDFGVSGRVMGQPSINWPASKEFRFEGWVDFNELPTQIDPPPAAYYFLHISDTTGGTAVVRMFVDAATDVLVTEYTLEGGGSVTCAVPLAGRADRWLHILTYCGDDGAGTNAVLSVYDSVEDTTTTDAKAVVANLVELSYPIYVGQLPSTVYGTANVPWRGFRGKLDEVKVATSAMLPPRVAHEPNPADGLTELAYSPNLTWIPGGHAIRSEVYFGTDYAQVVSARRLRGDIDGNGVVNILDMSYVMAQWLEAPVPPCPDVSFDGSVNFADCAITAGDYGGIDMDAFRGFTSMAAYTPEDLQANTTYYWRIDSADCNGVTQGPVWSFSTGSAKASLPDPPNGAMSVCWDMADNTVTLSWARGFAGASTTYGVYYGTSATSMPLMGTTTSTSIKTPAVAVNRKYYWRVDNITGGVTTTGDIWSFTTQSLPAFPEAEGFGRLVTGARGAGSPTVYHVTNLNASGSGSFAAGAVLSNRYIVFDVGGYITISSKLGITGNNLTIAGQTAPGGIGIKGAGVSIGGDNIILRHMRFRPGDSASSADALNINSNVDGLIIDHCSIQFGTDENNSMDNPLATTVQWTFNAWGLQTHSCGSLLYARDTTVHHTLWAHNHTRNPKSRDGLLDWVNNIVFDWDIPFICADSTGGYHYANVVNSYFISALSGQSMTFTSALLDSMGNPTYHMYLDNTLSDMDTDGVLDGTDKGYRTISGRVEQMAGPFSRGYTIQTDSPLDAYRRVLSLGGAMPWERDEVDGMLVADVANQTRRIIDSEMDLWVSNWGFGTLGGGTRPADSDNDGMPDFWEEATGTSKTVADFNGDIDGDGYKNIEEYLNWLGSPNAQTMKNTYVDVDLRKFSAGFGTSATYGVSGAVNGSITMTGSFTARFTPTTNFAGLGRFDLLVTDTDGSSMTVTVNVLVRP